MQYLDVTPLIGSMIKDSKHVSEVIRMIDIIQDTFAHNRNINDLIFGG